MKKLVFIFTILFTASIFSQEAEITKNLGDFSTLKVFNGISIELIEADEQKLEVYGEKSDKVKIKNVNNTLSLSLKFPEINADGKVNIKLYYKKKIDVIDANGGVTITGNSINQSKVEIKSQERAFIDLAIKVKYLTVKATSGGIIKLSGETKVQDIDVDLYGVYHGYELKVSGNTSIKAGLGTKAEIATGDTLKAKVSFGGSIFYKGDPEVIKDKKVVGGIIQKKQ